MPHTVTDLLNFRSERAWGALDVGEVEGATVRLHWTDEPYEWHVNDGEEVFLVMTGAVDMHFRLGDEEHVTRLSPGDAFVAGAGDAHVAHPVGEARILVIERKGSI